MCHKRESVHWPKTAWITWSACCRCWLMWKGRRQATKRQMGQVNTCDCRKLKSSNRCCLFPFISLDFSWFSLGKTKGRVSQNRRCTYSPTYATQTDSHANEIRARDHEAQINNERDCFPSPPLLPPPPLPWVCAFTPPHSTHSTGQSCLVMPWKAIAPISGIRLPLRRLNTS